MLKKIGKIVGVSILGLLVLIGLGTVVILNLPQQSVNTTNVLESPEPMATNPEALPTKTKKVKALTLTKGRVVTLIDKVDALSVNIARARIMELEKTPGPIILAIDSPGGGVLEGAQLITTIENSAQPVYTVCVGTCASMGAVIFSYGKKRMMVDRAVLMFHDAAGGTRGDVSHMQSILNFINRYVAKSNAYIAKRANMPLEKFQSETYKNIWIDGEDAVNAGFADELVSLKLDRDIGQNSGTTMLLELTAKNKAFTELDSFKDPVSSQPKTAPNIESVPAFLKPETK